MGCHVFFLACLRFCVFTIRCLMETLMTSIILQLLLLLNHRTQSFADFRTDTHGKHILMRSAGING